MKNENLKLFAAQVAAMTASERAALALKMPILTIAGHAISPRNSCLLAMQSAELVTVIGGFRQWLAASRCVNKGEKAFYILCPMTGKAKDDGEKPTFFREVAMFDISQTSAI